MLDSMNEDTMMKKPARLFDEKLKRPKVQMNR